MGTDLLVNASEFIAQLARQGIVQLREIRFCRVAGKRVRAPGNETQQAKGVDVGEAKVGGGA